MISTLRASFFKHGYLLIIAAWMFTISFVITNYWVYDASPSKVKDKIEHKIQATEKKIKAFSKDTALLASLISEKPNDKKLNTAQLPFGIYIYTPTIDNDSIALSYWNSNVFTILPRDVKQADGSYFTVRQNGEYEIIKKTITLRQQPIILVAAIPIHWDYFIENKFLQKDFEGFKQLGEQYEISSDAKAIPIENLAGKTIFKIKEIQGPTHAAYDWLSIFLRSLFVFLIIIFLDRVATDIAEKHRLQWSLVFLIVAVGVIRLCTYYIPFPFDFNRISLFDPSVYASNLLHPSLGHLFINTIILFWIVRFWKFNSLDRKPSRLYLQYKWLKYVNLILLMLVIFMMSNITCSLVKDSKISFDVTNFFSLTIFSIVGFVTLTFLMLALYHVSHNLLRPIVASYSPPYIQLLVVAVSGLLYISAFTATAPAVNIAVLLWSLFYIALINWRKEDIQLPILKSKFFIFWVIIFALSITLLISNENQIVDVAQRRKIAERVVMQNDANGENAIGIAVSNINLNLLKQNFAQFYTEYANKRSKDSILNENFIGFLNRFETTIYTFDHLYQPLFNDDSLFNYASLSSLIAVYGKKTNIPDLYSYQTDDGKVNYVFSVAACDADKPSGYMLIVAKSKKYKSEALYPVLFSQDGSESNVKQDESRYAYATYNSGRLQSKFNDYDFPLQINTADLLPFSFSEHSNGSNNELWYNAGNTKTVIVVKTNARTIEIITLFAYLFFTFLVVVALFHIGHFLVNTKLAFPLLKSKIRLSMQSQIHFTVIFITVFSFVVIGYATISFFTNRFNVSNRQRLSTTIEMIANEITDKMGSSKESDKAASDSTTDASVFNNNDFDKRIAAVSEIHNVDINYYSVNGNLLASTQPHIYNRQLLNEWMNPSAFYHLKYDERNKYIQTEKIGTLSFLSMYMPIVDDKGNVTAFLNIPYLNSQVELNQEISNFIATIINLNAFIFLIAGAIAFLITQRVVASFDIITAKMREVNIGKKNEVIVWNKGDEIGDLVKEYNKMVEKLEQSAEALAKTEREDAWREMARQVAHEIKNPLTPMKLSIQYLERAIKNDQANAKELTQRVTATLIDQIDQLAKIAGDFSQFANINKAVFEKIDISQTLASITQLYAQGESIEVDYQPQAPVYIWGDKTQLSRLFTNLIKNAMEAESDSPVFSVDITQIQTDTEVIISIKDYGNGIPDNMKEHIFQPNFTTKSSGTGLGLAICKGIVENHKGSISFTTQAYKGTVFTVCLPLFAVGG